VTTPPTLTVHRDEQSLGLKAGGSWTVAHASLLEQLIAECTQQDHDLRGLSIDMAGVTALDTYGAWLVERLVRELEARQVQARIAGLPKRFLGLYEQVHRSNLEPPASPPPRAWLMPHLEAIGRGTTRAAREFVAFAEMLGAFGVSLGRVLTRPQAFRLTSTIHHLDRVAWQAVPIILLITFLIGGIIAQQGIFHFRKFGADVYVVDMVGILVLREIGVLIVAIMVAGRSGSSYTAELGAMKMREEIDALRTMGLDPVEVLILPRILALVVALPILTFLGSMAALYGGGLVAWFYGGMSPEIFIARLKEAISTTHFSVGLIKAPFMALVIGIVACAQGLQVKGSSESLGLQTTASVVISIFLVIVLDGLFAVFFAAIDM
jgi:phospholipid/cholesterol/gamma-HCH transport system permease protein